MSSPDSCALGVSWAHVVCAQCSNPCRAFSLADMRVFVLHPPVYDCHAVVLATLPLQASTGRLGNGAANEQQVGMQGRLCWGPLVRQAKESQLGAQGQHPAPAGSACCSACWFSSHMAH